MKDWADVHHVTYHLNPEEESQTPTLLSIPGDPQKQFLNASRFTSQSFQCGGRKDKSEKNISHFNQLSIKTGKISESLRFIYRAQSTQTVKNDDNSIFSSKSWISCGNVRAFVKHGTFTKGFGGKYLQEESDGWSSIGAGPHRSYSAETKSRTSLDCVLQLPHCAHFRWGEFKLF